MTGISVYTGPYNNDIHKIRIIYLSRLTHSRRRGIFDTEKHTYGRYVKGLDMKDTREKIIRQAVAYFNNNDYERASLKDIAGALGITKGGIYHYFSSKDELFKESVIFTLGQMETEFSALTVRTGGLSIRDTLRLWFSLEDIGASASESMGIDIYKDYENMAYMMFTAIRKFPEVRERIDEVYEGFISKLETLLLSARREGEIRQDLDTAALAFEICAYGEGAMLLGSLSPSIPLGQMSTRAFENFWNRIKA